MLTVNEITTACLGTGALRVVRCRKSVLVFYGPNMTPGAKLLMALLAQPAHRGIFSVRLQGPAAEMEETLVIVKPDAMQRGLVEEVLRRFQKTGLVIRQRKELTMDRSLTMALYDCHKGKPFFETYVAFMTSGPAVSAVLQGVNAIERARAALGHYDPEKAKPGTIRKDLGIPDDRGILSVGHASDSPEAARREIALFFGAEG